MRRKPTITKTRVEVWIQSLEGVIIDTSVFSETERIYRPPPIIATVAFTGSAEDMQVGSSMVCGISGQLLIESEPLQLQEKPLVAENGSLCLGSAVWKDERKALGPQAQPHLTIHMPNKLPSSSSNDDPDTSREPALVEAETQSTFSDSAPSFSQGPANTVQERETKESYRGATSIWSNSGAALPEIVELTVRLKTPEDMFPRHKGIAHMVVFGCNEQEGSYMMDLPIRQQAFANTSPNGDQSPQLLFFDRCFASNAILRVRITVVHEKESINVLSASDSSSTTTSSMPSPPPVALRYTRSYLERQIHPLMEKINEHEKQAKEHKQAQKHAMDVKVPQGDTSRQQQQQHRTFCEGLRNLRHFMQTMACAMMRCNDGDGTMDHVVVPDSAASIDSTIETRGSLGI